MIKGETRGIKYLLALDAYPPAVGSVAFAPTSFAVTVTLPDGSLVTLDSSGVQQDPSGITAYTYYALFDVTAAGEYNVQWRLGTAGTYAIIVPQVRYAFYTDVPSIVRQRLSRKISTVSDELIENEYANMVRNVYLNYPDLPVYDSLGVNDRYYLERGLAALTACTLRRYIPKVPGLGGEVTKWRVQQTEFQFAPTAQDTSSVDALCDEAANYLQLVTAIRSVFTTRMTNFRTFRLVGASRAMQTRQPIRSLYDYVALLVSDTWGVR